ncbi:MAG TPA: hypothetical protein VN328_10385 [Thermodesulfovibrionales bacterium]|nr:hypothetical protein [Thermodesulfovibrionales bacterium]
MKKSSLLNKAASVCGPVMRVLLGAGSLALLVIGMKKGPRKDPGDTGSGKTSSH